MFCFRIVLDLQRVSACGDSVSSMVTILHYCVYQSQLPYGSDSKESTCNAGHPGSIPRSGRSAGEGNGNPLQYSCLENPMNGGAWRAQSTGSQRIAHDCATNTHIHTGGAVAKNPPSRKRRFSPWVGNIPWNGKPLQYSCLGNPIDREAWQATVHGVTKLDTT